MSGKYDEADPAQDAWKRQLLEARQRARDALSECAGPHIDNWQAVNAPEVVQFAHAQVMDYHRHIAPKATGIQPKTLWKAELPPVAVPATQTLDGGMTDWFGEYDVEEITNEAEREPKPVSLETLREEWSQESYAVVTVKLSERETGDTITEYERYDFHLPPAACDAVLGQLDKCLENLGWLPDAGEVDVGADDQGPEQNHEVLR